MTLCCLLACLAFTACSTGVNFQSIDSTESEGDDPLDEALGLSEDYSQLVATTTGTAALTALGFATGGLENPGLNALKGIQPFKAQTPPDQCTDNIFSAQNCPGGGVVTLTGSCELTESADCLLALQLQVNFDACVMGDNPPMTGSINAMLEVNIAGCDYANGTVTVNVKTEGVVTVGEGDRAVNVEGLKAIVTFIFDAGKGLISVEASQISAKVHTGEISCLAEAPAGFECFFDADSDFVPDGADNCPLFPNPSQTDLDEDGVGDICDNCLAVPNPDQSNADGDLFGDACDPCPDDATDSCPILPDGVLAFCDDLGGPGGPDPIPVTPCETDDDCPPAVDGTQAFCGNTKVCVIVREPTSCDLSLTCQGAGDCPPPSSPSEIVNCIGGRCCMTPEEEPANPCEGPPPTCDFGDPGSDTMCNSIGESCGFGPGGVCCEGNFCGHPDTGGCDPQPEPVPVTKLQAQVVEPICITCTDLGPVTETGEINPDCDKQWGLDRWVCVEEVNGERGQLCCQPLVEPPPTRVCGPTDACDEDADCPSNGHCDRELCQCVKDGPSFTPCDEDADCIPDEQACILERCTPVGSCESDADCPGGLCNISEESPTGKCAPRCDTGAMCQGDGDCGGDPLLGHCDTNNNVCVCRVLGPLPPCEPNLQCFEDADCGPGGICDPNTKPTVPGGNGGCLCPAGSFCGDGLLQEGEGCELNTNNPECLCPDPLTCNPTTCQCEEFIVNPEKCESKFSCNNSASNVPDGQSCADVVGDGSTCDEGFCCTIPPQNFCPEDCETIGGTCTDTIPGSGGEQILNGDLLCLTTDEAVCANLNLGLPAPFAIYVGEGDPAGGCATLEAEAQFGFAVDENGCCDVSGAQDFCTGACPPESCFNAGSIAFCLDECPPLGGEIPVGCAVYGQDVCNAIEDIGAPPSTCIDGCCVDSGASLGACCDDSANCFGPMSEADCGTAPFPTSWVEGGTCEPNSCGAPPPPPPPAGACCDDSANCFGPMSEADCGTAPFPTSWVEGGTCEPNSCGAPPPPPPPTGACCDDSANCFGPMSEADCGTAPFPTSWVEGGTCEPNSCGAPPPPPAVEDCTNRIDDDGDGAVDCADRDCALDAACAR